MSSPPDEHGTQLPEYSTYSEGSTSCATYWTIDPESPEGKALRAAASAGGIDISLGNFGSSNESQPGSVARSVPTISTTLEKQPRSEQSPETPILFDIETASGYLSRVPFPKEALQLCSCKAQKGWPKPSPSCPNREAHGTWSKNVENYIMQESGGLINLENALFTFLLNDGKWNV
jgi:hypothetical protein